MIMMRREEDIRHLSAFNLTRLPFRGHLFSHENR